MMIRVVHSLVSLVAVRKTRCSLTTASSDTINGSLLRCFATEILDHYLDHQSDLPFVFPFFLNLLHIVLTPANATIKPGPPRQTGVLDQPS
jgi:hypothetical protein